MGHGLMENRHGLLVDACLTLADGHAERVAALHMIEPRADRPQAITLGADKAYDAEDFINELRSMKVTPHVAQNTSGRSSAIDGRTTRHGGYAVSQRIRKRIEEAFGWIKTVAGQEKTKFRGRDRVGWAFTFAAAAYNLVRLPKLHGGADMTAPADCQLIGRWRIVEADLWDRGYLDLGGPATITIGADNNGEIAFGALQAGLDLSYSPSMVFFTWGGCDEMDEVTGDGSRRTARRRLDRDHIRLSQRRRGHPQGQTGYFFNSLLDRGPGSGLSTIAKRVENSAKAGECWRRLG